MSLPSMMCEHSEKMVCMNQETVIESSSAWTAGIPASQTVRNIRRLFIRHTVCGALF